MVYIRTFFLIGAFSLFFTGTSLPANWYISNDYEDIYNSKNKIGDGDLRFQIDQVLCFVNSEKELSTPEIKNVPNLGDIPATSSVSRSFSCNLAQGIAVFGSVSCDNLTVDIQSETLGFKVDEKSYTLILGCISTKRK